ncbi:hypothetical protein GOP47_0017855 [Adiantum capillus-veneris]|uniref:BAH domain-containing protein n=1 Tax=Adiantum capillus-veneris TaxID=13818 RepID=A0A9D4ZAZ0_ADICA|nr:hypothetical protein GOP47_0017855 [Adiantum capillus-veneris]
MANEEEDRAYMSSCSNEGVEYRLYDIVKIFDKEFAVPHIGKILKMWEERSSGTRKALVCWFLWHKEVKPHDADNPKELFLAFGEGKGVTNELKMDSIVGKCKVVCISSDPRNKEPSVSDVENADFVYSHAYDVDLKHTFPVKVVADKLGPDAIFNTEEWLLAVTKIEGKTNEFKSKKSIKSSLLESKKRPRDAEVASKLQKKKIDKQDELTTQKKKVKVSDGKAPIAKENAREGSVSKQEEMVQSKRQLLKSEELSRLRKAQIADVKVPALTDGAVLDKASSPRELAPDMHDIMEQTDSLINDIVRQVNDETVLGEKSKGEDSKELESRAGNVSKVERTPEEGREAADHEGDIADGDKVESKKALAESDFSWQEDLNKGSMFKLLKKTKSSLTMEPEKRTASAVEPLKQFEKRKIFRELPWEESLQRGIPQGRVLHLHNIDPLVTSADMREMLKSAFQGLSDARILPQEASCPSGQAIAIFESRLLAESALEAIEKNCLVMADKKWPVIASRVKESLNQARFPGHLALEKLKLGRNLTSDEFVSFFYLEGFDRIWIMF